MAVGLRECEARSNPWLIAHLPRHTMPRKPQQRPLSITDQITNLKNLGLIIEDETAAASFLNEVSYFRLIKAFSLGLKPKNGKYDDGVSFNQIKELYLFNSHFRQLLFVRLEQVEISFRCRTSNYFSSKHGVLSYEDSSLFSNQAYHEKFMQDAKNEIYRNKRAPFIRNFRDNYVDGKVPLYALVEILSFGTLSKFYKNMKNSDKKKIANSYNVPYTYLESWIECFAYIRNICAHYGRLYNAKLTKKPKLFHHDRNKGIDSQRVFGVLICLKYLIGQNHNWESFIEEIDSLFTKYPHVQKEMMGFPVDWKNLLRS